MKKNDFILVCGGFKTATETLSKTFECEKEHDVLVNLNKKIKIIILPFRYNEEVYPSAYFQDITMKEYEYSPFYFKNFLAKYINLDEEEKKKIIKETPIEKFVSHYKSIDWEKYLHLNNKKRIKIINEKYKINIKYESKEIQFFEVANRIFISFNVNQINKQFEKILKIMNDCGFENNNIKLSSYNVGKTKWYSEIYNNFLKIINQKKGK